MTRPHSTAPIAWLVLLATGLVSACAPAAAPSAPTTAAVGGAPANVTFQLNWIPNIQHFGPVYAERQGFYKDVGLTVKVNPGGQGIDGLQMVAAGAADIAVSGAPTIYAANEKGLGVVAFAAVYQKSSSALVCRGDRGIQQFSDLAGKNFGSKGPSDVETLPRVLAKNGIDPSAVKITPIGASSITELIAGVVDCQLAFAVNEPISMRKAGVEPVVFNLADHGYGGQSEVYITRQKMLDEQPDVLVRFLQATGKGWGAYLDDPQAAATWVVDSKLVDGLDVEQQKAQAVAMSGLVSDEYSQQHGLLALNPTLWEEQAKQALDEGRISAPPDIERARTMKILQLAALPKR